MMKLAAMISVLFVMFSTVCFGQEFSGPINHTVKFRNNTLIIEEDRGGAIVLYMQQYMQMAKDHVRLALDGECDSACTLFLGILPQNTVCITENAKIGIHRSNRPEGTMVMMMNYPTPILMWIMTEGITEDIKYLPDEMMKTMWPQCPGSLIHPGEKVE